MYRIIKKDMLTPNIVFMRFEAPKIASSAHAGQFVIIRADETGERIPMMIADWDKEKGTMDIVFFILGTSTSKLASLKEGESVTNIAGPLGKPAEVEKFRHGYLRLRLLWNRLHSAAHQGPQRERQSSYNCCRESEALISSSG